MKERLWGHNFSTPQWYKFRLAHSAEPANYPESDIFMPIKGSLRQF